MLGKTIKGNVIALFVGLVLVGCAHDPWTRTDSVLAGGSILAAIADGYTTKRMLDNPRNYEMSPLMGERPSDTRVVVTMGMTQVFTIIVSYFLPKEYRQGLLIGKTGVNMGLAIHNSRLD